MINREQIGTYLTGGIGRVTEPIAYASELHADMDLQARPLTYGEVLSFLSDLLPPTQGARPPQAKLSD